MSDEQKILADIEALKAEAAKVSRVLVVCVAVWLLSVSVSE